MIRRFSYIIAALMATINVACQSDIDTVVPVADDNTPEGWVAIEFGTNVPVMTEVEVRAADPDGIDVHNLTLFCFNAYGLYIAHVEAEIADHGIEHQLLRGDVDVGRHALLGEGLDS